MHGTASIEINCVIKTADKFLTLHVIVSKTPYLGNPDPELITEAYTSEDAG